jgi:hypothetical protein
MGAIARRIGAGIATLMLAATGMAAANADPVTLPAMTAGNGGPIIGGGNNAGIAGQLFTFGTPNVQEVSGSDAAAFINAAASVSNPQLSGPFSLLRRALACQNNNAGFGARAFRRTDGLWGGGVLVTSKSTAGNVDALVSCAKTNWRRATAGGESAMCNNGWTTPVAGEIRKTEVYYVMLAGTSADFCADLNAKYKVDGGGWPS